MRKGGVPIEALHLAQGGMRQGVGIRDCLTIQYLLSGFASIQPLASMKSLICGSERHCLNLGEDQQAVFLKDDMAKTVRQVYMSQVSPVIRDPQPLTAEDEQFAVVYFEVLGVLKVSAGKDDPTR